MRICEKYYFNGVKGFKLGWSLLGPPLLTVYCYILDDLMIDTGQSHMQKEVLQIAGENNIKRIFLTHHHEDHSGNAASIKQHYGTTVYGQSLTKDKMEVPFHILPYQKYVWGKSAPVTIEPFPNKIETALGEMVSIHTPGHSKDHTSFLLREAGLLFSGDLYLADKIKFFRSDEDVGTQITSLKKILKLDFDTLLCNHYPKLEQGKNRIERKLAFLEDLYGNIIELKKKGYSENEIFNTLKLKESYFIKYFCFGNVSMINGVRSVIRHHETKKSKF
ncbi:MAG: MBL fold metallo-hydrolase [Desulfobacterales bacterium]|nr:MBL fold metallo-hydrolase [Desulfobacterales bacterium]